MLRRALPFCSSKSEQSCAERRPPSSQIVTPTGRGLLWGTYTTLDDPLSVGTFATGINDAGQIVGYYVADASPHSHGYLYSIACDHENGRPARSPSVTRDEQAAQRAAWERYEAADARAKTPL
jgi:hypothetical protein